MNVCADMLLPLAVCINLVQVVCECECISVCRSTERDWGEVLVNMYELFTALASQSVV